MTNKGIIWLNSLESWNGKNFSPLDEPRAILNNLDNPQNSYPCIHIAGTNGKGSVTSYLSQILIEQQNYKIVGKMTSPHLFELTERAQINGKNIDSIELDNSLLVIKETCTELRIIPTYFVALTCAIFLSFKRLNVDIAVIETGLGGRYDATNLILKPLSSVITSISYDHEDILGGTISNIAWNKAGIIKPNVPIFIGELPEEAEVVIKKEAQENNSVLIKSTNKIIPDEITTSNLADFQIRNITLAITVADYLGVENKFISKGINNTKWFGRYEKFNKFGSTFIIDVSHNEEGIKSLFSEILKLDLKDKKINLFMGALKRKANERFILTLKNELIKISSNFNLYICTKKISINEGALFIEEFCDLDSIKNNFTGIKNLSSIENSDLETIKIDRNSIYVFFGSTYFYSSVTNWLHSNGINSPQP